MASDANGRPSLATGRLSGAGARAQEAANFSSRLCEGTAAIRLIYVWPTVCSCVGLVGLRALRALCVRRIERTKTRIHRQAGTQAHAHCTHLCRALAIQLPAEITMATPMAAA